MTAGFRPTPNVIAPAKARTPECQTGRVLYVDGSRTDKYFDPNGSEQKPFKSIQEAINASPEYAFTGLEDLQMNVIQILPGQYNENLVIDRPITLVGTNVLTCHIEGSIIADTDYVEISDLTFWDLSLANTTLFRLINCYLDNITLTTCEGNINNCEMNNITIANCFLELFNNCKINETFSITDDELEPRPSGSPDRTRILMQDSKIELSTTVTYEILNGGDIWFQISHSLISAANTLITGMTMHNFNATIINLTKTVGTYLNYAGYPA